MTAVPTRIPALRQPPVTFAHRGARAQAPENTLEAFALARRLGATGIASEVWRTADGHAVLDAAGTTGGRLRRRAFAELHRADLPASVVALPELYDHVGGDLEVSLLVRDPDAVAETIATARDLGAAVEGRLWLRSPDLDELAGWRPLSSRVRLVHVARLRELRPGAEPHAARLRQLGVDAVSMHHSDWSGGVVTLFHRFGVLALAEDAQFERVLAEVVDAGIDGVTSDHVDRMVQTVDRFGTP